MPGARLRTFRLGDRSELLVEQLLASFAFTTRVPRQEDHGIDFFCNLISDEGQLLKAGPFFTVQAKSSTDPLVFEKNYELEWIKNQSDLHSQLQPPRVGKDCKPDKGLDAATQRALDAWIDWDGGDIRSPGSWRTTSVWYASIVGSMNDNIWPYAHFVGAETLLRQEQKQSQ